MITLKEFMEVVDYKITEGSEYCWQCFGPNAYRLDSWNQEQEGHSVSIVFDTRTHVVYETSAYDYKRNRAYRLINPDYKFAHDDEASGRGVDINQAWDDVNYIDLDVDDDFIQKALAIVADEDYDTRVEVPLTLPDDSLFDLMKLAHEADMTLNQYVEQILRQAIEREELAKELDDIRIDEDGWDKIAEDHLDDDMRDEYDFSDGVRGAPAKMTAKKKKKGKK
jgi:hypothetical protein